MAPKVVAPVEPVLKVEKDPYGVFVNFGVTSASLVLDVPPPRPPTPPPPTKGGKGKAPPTPEPEPVDPTLPILPPQVHLSIAYPGEFNPVDGNPVAAEGGEETASPPGPTQPLTYPLNFRRGFRTEVGEDAVNALINSKVLLRVHESDKGRVLASVPIDLLPFALGEQMIELGDVDLEPASDVPNDGARLLSGSLKGLTIQLQQRKPVPEGTAPAAAPDAEGTAAAAAGGAGVGAAGAGAGAAGEDGDGASAAEPALPPLEPFTFISEDEAPGVNVVEFVVSAMEPLPASLQASAELVGGKDGAQGKITYNVGLKLPDDGPSVLMHSVFIAGGLTFGRKRQCVKAADIEALQGHLDEGRALAVEVNRVTHSEGFVDNVASAYWGLCLFPDCVSLLEAGATSLAPEGPQPITVCCEEVLASSGLVSCLPVYEASGGKVKPLEAETPEAGSSAWQLAGTSLSMSLLFHRPVVTPWEPPERPPKSMTELVPTRDLNPFPPPATADDDFREQVRGALQELASAYAAEPAPLPETASQPTAQRHRRVIFALNRSGQYDELRNVMKAPLVRIVKEKLGKTGTMNPQEMGPKYNELYSHLMDLAHLEMDSVCNVYPAPVLQPVPTKGKLTSLWELANEFEAQGKLDRAEALHLVRLLDGDNAQVWFDHAVFKTHCAAAAAGSDSAAEDASLAAASASLQAALAIDPAHTEALSAMALVSLMQYIKFSATEQAVPAPTDAAEARGDEDAEATSGAEFGEEFLRAAIAAAYALVDVCEGGALPWALMALVYGADMKKGGASLRNHDWTMCHQEVQRLERKALSSEELPSEANGYFQLWTLLLKVTKLKDLACMVQKAVPSLRRSHREISYDLALASARTLSLPGRVTPLQATAPAPASVEGGHPSEDEPTGVAVGEAEESMEGRGNGGEGSTSEGAAVTEGGSVIGEPSSSADAAETAGTAVVSPEEMAAEVAAAQQRELFKLLRKIKRENPDESDVMAIVLRGDAEWAAGGSSATEDAMMSYQDALEKNASACGLMVHLRLAEAYMLRGQPEYALDVCTAALETNSSPALWLAAARANIKLEDLAGANLALTEANLIDPENPESWGLLALVAIRLGKEKDSTAALEQACKVGLKNADTFCSIASEFSDIGNYHAAEHVLKMAVKASQLESSTKQVHFQLGCALVEQKEGHAAHAQLEAASALCEDETALSMLNKLALRIEALPLPGAPQTVDV